MIELNSLNLQLDNLKVAFNNAIIKKSSLKDVKKIYNLKNDIEKLISERKANLENSRRRFMKAYGLKHKF